MTDSRKVDKLKLNMFKNEQANKDTDKKNILVVEDSSTMRSFIVSALEELPNITILESANGFEAIKILPHHNINLVITDINMPDINGLELVSFLRKHPLYKDIPIIIVTTESTAQDRNRGLSLGANEYITKPFQNTQLLSAVKRLFSTE